MTDDTNDSQVADQTSDESFWEGFAETEDKSVSEKSGEQAQKNDAPEGSGQEKPIEEKKPEAENAPVEKTAQERLEERAQANNKPAKPEKPAEQPVAAAPVASPAEQPAPVSGDKWIDDLLKRPEVANTKIGIEGKETTIEDFAESYPEAVQAPVAIAKVMIDQAIKEIQAQSSAQMQALSAKLSNMEFWDGVHRAHSDARQVAASKEFKEWVGKQSAMTQNLLASENVADGVAVLDAYKESLAKTAKEGKDKEAGRRKEVKDGLHGSTLRGKGGDQPERINKDEDDFDAGFNKK